MVIIYRNSTLQDQAEININIIYIFKLYNKKSTSHQPNVCLFPD